MHTNGALRKHWFHISFHFALDSVLFYIATLAGILIRFRSDFDPAMASYWPYLMFTAVVFSATTYIFGLYSTHSASQGVAKRAGVLMVCTFIAIGIFVAGTYVHSFRPIGRGAVLICAGLGYIVTLLHHLYILHTLRHHRERVAYVISCEFDEMETRLFRSFGTKHLDLVGVVEHNGYHAKGDARILGHCTDLMAIVRRDHIHRNALQRLGGSELRAPWPLRRRTLSFGCGAGLRRFSKY